MKMAKFAQSQPTVSIITVTHNAEKHLEKAILGIIYQTFASIEYIIIDNDSYDNTINIIKKYQDKINQFISEPDHGIYDAFNKGIRLATGGIIFFLNSDDCFNDEKVIADVLVCFGNNPDLLIIYGNTLVIDDKTGFRYTRGKPFTLEDLKTGDMPPHQGFFVRKELVEKVGLFDTQYKIAGDFDFIIRCFKAAEEKSYYFNRTIAVFREGGVSTNPEKQQMMNREQRQIIKKHFGCDQVPNLQLDEINSLYKEWLESFLLREKGITHCLHDYQVKNVAIYGTMKTALYLLHDLKQEGFHIIGFLDKNRNMQGQFIEGVPVYPPEWLGMNPDKLDGVVLSIEGGHDLSISEQLKGMITDNRVKICSWKDLARGKLPW
jgi:GT2 family glycosyltransferase